MCGLVEHLRLRFPLTPVIHSLRKKKQQSEVSSVYVAVHLNDTKHLVKLHLLKGNVCAHGAQELCVRMCFYTLSAFSFDTEEA